MTHSPAIPSHVIPATETLTTGGAAAVASLVAHGVDTLFGLPGVQLDHLFNALYDAGDAIRVINARHEQGVAYMALGYAQSSGRPGAYAVVPGPGFLNTGAALSTAYACWAPVMAIAGQISSDLIGKGWGELHELPDQTVILRGLTRWNGIAMAPHEVPAVFGAAFAALAEGRGPVGIELPRDVLKAAAMLPAPRTSDVTAYVAPDPDLVKAAAALLAAARQPMIIVGGGAMHAPLELAEVAGRLQAPVVSHLQGRGVLDDRNPLSVSQHVAAPLWAASDVILAVGTRMHAAQRDWGMRPGQKVIRVDIEPRRFGLGVAPDIAVEADTRAFLIALAAALETTGPAAPSRLEDLAARKAASQAEFERVLGPQMAYVKALRAALPEEAAIVCDYTQVGYVATSAFPVYRPRQLITPGYQGTLGFGCATGLGAKVGTPDRPVVSLNGDGGFLFTGNELATAAKHDIRAITVVFADGAYGNVRRMQRDDYGGRLIASDLKNPDFVRYAESFGVAARRVQGPDGFGEAIRWAMDEKGPTLIEVPVEAMPDPWALLEPGAA